MSRLQVYTAFASYRAKDKLDVSRKSGVDAFAPSWRLLNPFLTLRKGVGLVDADWDKYVADYKAEMRESYGMRSKRPIWDELLSRQVVTLTCYCKRPEQCHRSVLGEILEKLGADFIGEHQGLLF